MQNSIKGVTPTKAGVQKLLKRLDSRFRGNDNLGLLQLTRLSSGSRRRRFVLDLIVVERQVRTGIDTEDESFQGFMLSIAEKGGALNPH